MENEARINAEFLNGLKPGHPFLQIGDDMEFDLVYQYGDLEKLVGFLDENPDPMFRIRRDGVVTYANTAGRELLRYWQIRSEDEGLPLPVDLAGLALENGSRSQRELEIDGRIYLLACIPGADESALVYVRDVTERRRVNDARRRRDAILQVVTFAAERFLGVGSWQSHIDEVLERLGAATGASRIYIHENRSGQSTEQMITLRHQWTAPDIGPVSTGAGPRIFSLTRAGLGRWEQMLKQGYIISGGIDSFPPDERAVLMEHAVCSILMVPIFVGDRWWGAMGFEECRHSGREWEPREVEALKAATRILGSAILNTQAKEDIRHQKEFTRLVIDTDPNLIYVKDASGRFLLANQATADLYGMTVAEIVGLSNWHLHNVPEEVMAYQESDREVLQSLTEVAVLEQYTRADGRVQWFETIKKPLIQPDGVVHVLGISADITERRRAELILRNREQQQEAVVNLGLHALAGEGLKELMERAIIAVRDMLGVDLVAIWEVTRNADVLVLNSGFGWQEGQIGHASIGMGTESQAGFVLQHNAPVIVSDWDKETRFRKPERLTAHGIRSGLTVLIHGKAQPFGVFSAHAVVTRNFTDDDINFLQAVANVLAYAIEWKQSEEALRESEERYRIVAETATDAILTVDQDSRIIFANQSTQNVFGYTTPEILWQDLGLLLAAPIEHIQRTTARESEERFIEVLANGRSVELQGRHKSGAMLPLEVSIGEFVKNGRRYFTCIIRDITERKHAERDINVLNEELRQANELLTMERDREKKHVAVLEELNLMKSEFVSSVSHELRTPLASIIGFAQTIMVDPDLPVDMRQEFLQIILEEGKRLAKLINDLLDLARIESGRVVLENSEGDMVALVKRALQSIVMQASAKSIAVSTVLDEESIVAVFDHDRMLQVLINLLSNAVKFTSDGGRIDIRARVERGDVVVDICDTGLGIPAGDIPRLFEKFFRVHRPGMEIRGTGLGLAIAKHAVELQRGTLTVQSEENRGSTFTIRFPQR